MAATQCISTCRRGDFQYDKVVGASLARLTVSQSDRDPKEKYPVSCSSAKENCLVDVRGSEVKTRQLVGDCGKATTVSQITTDDQQDVRNSIRKRVHVAVLFL